MENGLTNVLNTEEVLAVRSVGRNGCRDVLPIPAAPSIRGKIGVLPANGLFTDLEPLARAVISLDSVTWGPRQVN